MQNPEADQRLYSGDELREEISRHCANARNSVTIFSAYVKLSGLRWLNRHVPSDIRVKVICRWQMQDLVFGASDLDCYPFCKKRGWDFGIDQNLHSKAYIVDHETIFLGSSNLTSRGLSINMSGNLELGTAIKPTALDVIRLQQLEDSCCWLDDNLFAKIDQEVQPHLTKSETLSFSESLMDQIYQPVEFLWISEIPHSAPLRLLDEEDADVQRDIETFEIVDRPITPEVIIDAFKRSRVRQWFFGLLEANSEEVVRFGWLTAKLHDALLDEPPPNRRDVKHYTACLIEWLNFCETDTLEFTQHRRTVSIKIKA